MVLHGRLLRMVRTAPKTFVFNKDAKIFSSKIGQELSNVKLARDDTLIAKFVKI